MDRQTSHRMRGDASINIMIRLKTSCCEHCASKLLCQCFAHSNLVSVTLDHLIGDQITTMM